MSQQDVIDEILKTFSEKQADCEVEKNYGEEYLTQLKSACKNFLRKESFEVGQIVRWKENLQNRMFPHKNQPAIVIAILDEPVISTDDKSGSPYFLETLDIILGIIVDDGTFQTFTTTVEGLRLIKYEVNQI